MDKDRIEQLNSETELETLSNIKHCKRTEKTAQAKESHDVLHRDINVHKKKFQSFCWKKNLTKMVCWFLLVFTGLKACPSWSSTDLAALPAFSVDKCSKPLRTEQTSLTGLRD